MLFILRVYLRKVYNTIRQQTLLYILICNWRICSSIRLICNTLSQM